MTEDRSVGDPFVAVEARLQAAANKGRLNEENVTLRQYGVLITSIVKIPATDIEMVYNSFPR